MNQNYGWEPGYDHRWTQLVPLARELNWVQPAMPSGHAPVIEAPYYDPCRDGHNGTTISGEWATCTRCGRQLYKVRS